MEYKTEVAGERATVYVSNEGVARFVLGVRGAGLAAHMVQQFLDAEPGSLGRGEELSGLVHVERKPTGEIEVTAWCNPPRQKPLTVEEREQIAIRERDEARAFGESQAEEVKRLRERAETAEEEADIARALLREAAEKQAEAVKVEAVKP